MIGGIKGTLIEKCSSPVLCTAASLAYEIFVDKKTLSFVQSYPDGQDIFLYCNIVFGQQDCRIYGFLTKEEKELFLSLRSISGIGPSIALEILGTLSITDLYNLVSSKDVNMLSSVKGVGKKVANRIINEIKVPFMINSNTHALSDLRSALINLGYGSSDIISVIRYINNQVVDYQTKKFDELLKIALSYIADRK